MKNLYLIKTDKPSRLGYLTKKGKEVFKDLRFFNRLMPVILDGENENIYITDDSNIKEGNWYFDGADLVHKKTKYNDALVDGNKNAKKIILTTDEDLIADGVQKINNEFLQWFVQNSNCEEVKVENTCLELRVCDCAMNENCLKPGYKIIIPSKEVINPFELPNVLPDDVFNKSLEELAEKEYPKLIVENPSCNGYNEPNHIDINEECRNAFMEGVKSDKAKEMWIKSKEAEIYWHKKFNDNKYKS